MEPKRRSPEDQPLSPRRWRRALSRLDRPHRQHPFRNGVRPVHRPRAFAVDHLSPRSSPRPRAQPASRGPCRQRARTDTWFPARLRGRDDSFSCCAVCVSAQSVITGRAAQAHGAEAAESRGPTPQPASLEESAFPSGPAASPASVSKRSEACSSTSSLRRRPPVPSVVTPAKGEARVSGLAQRVAEGSHKFEPCLLLDTRVSPRCGSPKYDSKRNSGTLCG